MNYVSNILLVVVLSIVDYTNDISKLIWPISSAYYHVMQQPGVYNQNHFLCTFTACDPLTQTMTPTTNVNINGDVLLWSVVIGVVVAVALSVVLWLFSCILKNRNVQQNHQVCLIVLTYGLVDHLNVEYVACWLRCVKCNKSVVYDHCGNTLVSTPCKDSGNIRIIQLYIWCAYFQKIFIFDRNKLTVHMGSQMFVAMQSYFFIYRVETWNIYLW